jgi:hypothetical protein
MMIEKVRIIIHVHVRECQLQIIVPDIYRDLVNSFRGSGSIILERPR